MREIDFFESFRVSVCFVHYHVVVRHLLVALQRRWRTRHGVAVLQEGDLYRRAGALPFDLVVAGFQLRTAHFDRILKTDRVRAVIPCQRA